MSFLFFDGWTSRSRLGLTLTLAIACTLSAQGQAMLSGRVLDSQSGRPVPFASVFLANTLIGASADENGRYTLPKIPVGKYDVTATSVGYKTRSTPYSFEAGDTVKLNIVLDLDTKLLTEVTVTARSFDRKKYLKYFLGYLLGFTPNARRCEVMNVDSIELDVDDEQGILTASCPGPIIIQNEATGYALYYALTEFTLYYKSGFVGMAGYPRFEELTPKNVKQAEGWAKEREAAYHGSLTHFMKSLATHSLSQNEFEIRMLGDTILPKRNDTLRQFLHVSEDYVLSKRADSLSTLRIEYFGEKADPHFAGYGQKQISTMKFRTHGLVVHTNGYPEDMNNFVIEGYLGWSGGLADLVPLEYVPSQPHGSTPN